MKTIRVMGALSLGYLVMLLLQGLLTFGQFFKWLTDGNIWAIIVQVLFILVTTWFSLEILNAESDE
jgi:hypothetical protein